MLNRTDEIFLKFAAFYGSQFLSKWAGIDIDMVKAEWTDGLKRFNDATVGGALDTCREHNEYPPSLPEFIMMCRECFVPDPVPMIEHTPKEHVEITKEQAMANIAKIKEMLANSKMIVKYD